MNAGETLHKGIEFGLGAPITDVWRVDASLSYAKHTYEKWQVSGTADYSGNEMESAPRLIANTRLTYSPGYMNGGRIQLEWFKLGSYYHDQTNTTKYDGHDLVNLRANYPFDKRWEMFGAINNLTDTRYAETVGMDGSAPTYTSGLPRTFVVGVQAKW
jgi:outer membrane receptor protein involved in Fe transport